jgi:hypothetical protein
MHRVLIVVALGCGNRESTPTPAPAPVAADAAAPVKRVDRGPLSAEPPVWPDATGPAGPVTFVRDFKKSGSWHYDYRQNMTMTAAVSRSPHVSAMQAKGTLTVDSKRDGTAIARLSADLEAQDVGEVDRQRTHMSFELTLDEKTIRDTDDSQAAMVALLLPFPAKPMKIGDTDSFPFTLPVTGVSGLASVSGPLTLTLVGYSKLAGRTCARFDTKLAISEQHGTGRVTMTLDGKVCIDPADAAVVASFLAIDMKLVSRGPDGIDMSLAGVLALDRM